MSLRLAIQRSLDEVTLKSPPESCPPELLNGKRGSVEKEKATLKSPPELLNGKRGGAKKKKATLKSPPELLNGEGQTGEKEGATVSREKQGGATLESQAELQRRKGVMSHVICEL